MALGGMIGGLVGSVAGKLAKGGPGLKRKTDDDTGVAKAHPGSKAASMMKPTKKRLSIGRSLSMR